MIEAINEAWKDAERRQVPLALLVDQRLRRPMKKILARTTPDLGLIAYQEIPNDLIIDSVSMLQFETIVGADAVPDVAGVNRSPAGANAGAPVESGSGRKDAA